ncbi:MAG: hypothetical protein IJG68_01230 [Bacilli bacterium]|nr:hypothetical protein [Bacilli bacterium]
MEYDIDKLVSEMDFTSNQLQRINQNILLTNHEIEILSRYHIEYQKCKSLKEVIWEIENILEDMDIVDEDLDLISQTISERDYYENTNK